MPKLLAIILSLTIAGCSSATITDDGRRNEINIAIVQNNVIIEPENNTYRLRRAPFSIRVTFKQPDGLLIHASLNDRTYLKAEAAYPLNELSGFMNTSIAEELFNMDSVIHVSESAPGYWYYTDETDHRFNSVVPGESGYLCIREVSTIIDLDSGKEPLPLSRMKGDTLYIVIMKTDWNKDYTERIELNRKVIKITFSI
jgi:hypothetical protein